MKVFPLNIRIGALDAFTGTFANLSNKMDRLGKKATRLGKSLTTSLTLPIAGLGLFSVKSAADIEQMTVALEGMTGGAEGAKKLMGELMAFSAATPFQLEGISDAARMLLATEKIRVDEIQSALKVAGDIAAGSKSEISEIAYVMSKAASKGRADMEILNMFLERGIPIMGALQRETGANQKQLEKMVSQGKITYETLYNAMQNLTLEGGVFENMMAKQSVTIKGLLSTLSDNFKLATAAIGDSIVKTTKFQERITSLTNAIQGFVKWFNGLPPIVQEIGVWTAIALAGLGPLLMILGQILIGIAALIAFSAQLAVIWGVIAAVAPWVALVALLIGLATVFTKLQIMAGGFGNALMVVGGVILDFILTPLKLVLVALSKIGKFLKMDVSGLDGIINYSFGQAAADRAVSGENNNRNMGAGNAITLQKELDVNNKSQADINVKFDNMPKGARTTVDTQSNANVTVDQGVSMGDNY